MNAFAKQYISRNYDTIKKIVISSDKTSSFDNYPHNFSLLFLNN